MKRWNAGPKLLVVSSVTLLLSIGLCSKSGDIIADGGDAALWGLILFLLSIVGLIVGAIMSIVQGTREGEK